VLQPSQVALRDGHHGAAIEAAMQDVLGDTYSRPPTQHRLARKKLMIGPGELIVPPSGWHLHSIRYLDIECDARTTIIGYGDMPAVLNIDGSSFGRWRGGIIQARRAQGGGRADVPLDVVRVHKSLESHDHPQQTHFRFTGEIEGVWRDVGFRGGTYGWTTAQEDHYTSDEIQVRGTFDVHNDDAADLCRVGVFAGNNAWSNNRRHRHGYLHVYGCETAFMAQRAGAIVQILDADGCRDYVRFGGAVTKVEINGGEAEYCQRVVNDVAFQPHDHSLTLRGVYAKLDVWRPDLPGVVPKFAGNACGIWGSAGGLELDHVTIGSLPVERGPDGVLYFAPNGQRTTRRAPRIWSAAPNAHITTRHCSAHGYRATGSDVEMFALAAEGSGTVSHEYWRDTEVDSIVRQVHRSLHQTAKTAF
jgi:hypothetical protein